MSFSPGNYQQILKKNFYFKYKNKKMLSNYINLIKHCKKELKAKITEEIYYSIFSMSKNLKYY